MTTATELRALIQRGESSTLEFKVSTPLPENLARLLSSLANTEGGIVLVGIREPDVVTGTDPDRFKLLVPKGIARLSGNVGISHEVVDVDGRAVGVIHVSAAKSPIAAPDGYFRRVGDKQEPMSAQQLVDRMSAVPDHGSAIQSLSQTISVQTAEIGRLRESFENANSWKRKAFYALIGAAATAIVKLLLAAFGLAGA
jgi:predicted HTH transcriptional regulator